MCTTFFRNKNYHQPTDTLETLDTKRMTKVIDAIFLSIIHLKWKKYFDYQKNLYICTWKSSLTNKKQRSNVQNKTEFYSWIATYGGKASWFGTFLE